ncbi:MAG: glutaminyl-peptide cyclotransferase [Acidobacteria bacterium]|nr:glutaminyl-peptide cyclotransferase [Acidobacteriota bacterium]MBP7473764.1 glutaminyl-peptide cyclotransferase [Pyrinomonadaceae bacterium]MBP9110656.1 glutaminyl-peptide cyclotransferase [Pyrinomonadaceae bacterium]
MRLLVIFLAALASAGCSGTPTKGTNNAASSNNAKVASTPLPVYGYEVVKSYPHDPKAFTQGLFFHNGSLYESTGQEGESTIRRVELETGKVQQKWDLPRDEFGEGSTVLNDKIYMITWQDGVGRVFDSKDLKLIKEFSYVGEGWGITNDGTNLILSQGTHVLKFIEPEGFKQVKTLPVMREDGKPLMQLNELEFVKGEIWANIWHSEKPEILGKPNHIARIDPATGKILGWIDLSRISPDDQPATNDPYDPKAENTLNGIAYDAASDRLFVTGKRWKKLYEIKITPPKS